MDLIKFTQDYNLLKTTISVVFSTFVYDLVSSFGNNLVIPLIDINSNGKEDVKELSQIRTKVLGRTLKTGAFLTSLFKFIIMFCIVFTIHYIVTKM